MSYNYGPSYLRGQNTMGYGNTPRVYCPCDPRQGGLNSAYNNTRLGGYPAYNQGHRAIANARKWNGIGSCCGGDNDRYYYGR